MNRGGPAVRRNSGYKSLFYTPSAGAVKTWMEAEGVPKKEDAL